VSSPSESQSPQKLSPKAACKSGFLLIAAYLLAFDLLLTVLVPAVQSDWYFRSISGNNESFAKKVIEYVTTYDEPDVLLVGSSLTGVPSMTCDDVLLRGKEHTDELPNMFFHCHYSQSDYFANVLAQATGKKYSVVNLGLAGAVASDYFLIMQKAIEFKKKPALVVCTIAPAEFLWNDGRGVEKTRIKSAFKSYWWPTSPAWYELAFNKCYREVHFHWDNLQRELAQGRQEVVSWLSDLTHHPADFYTALENMKKGNGEDDDAQPAAKAKPKTGQNLAMRQLKKRGNELNDLELYRKRYSHLDMALYKQHMDNFKKMIKLCKDNDLPLVVVNMPLTNENKQLLDAKVAQDYAQRIASLTKEYKVPYVDMDTAGTYQLNDFYDSVHLNEFGGKKFFARLSAALGDQVKLNELCAARGAKPL
jgi:hypothetical protein